MIIVRAAVAHAFGAGSQQKEPLNNNNAPAARVDDFFHCSVNSVGTGRPINGVWMI